MRIDGYDSFLRELIILFVFKDFDFILGLNFFPISKLWGMFWVLIAHVVVLNLVWVY